MLSALNRVMLAILSAHLRSSLASFEHPHSLPDNLRLTHPQSSPTIWVANPPSSTTSYISVQTSPYPSPTRESVTSTVLFFCFDSNCRFRLSIQTADSNYRSRLPVQTTGFRLLILLSVLFSEQFLDSSIFRFIKFYLPPLWTPSKLSPIGLSIYRILIQPPPPHQNLMLTSNF